MICYIPVGGDLDLTEDAVRSIIQEYENNNIPGEIILINNTNTVLELNQISNSYERITIMNPPVPLLHGQSINWMIKDTYTKGNPFCMSLHNDAKLQPGALKEMLEYYETIKATQWGAITLGRNNGDAFVFWNPLFNYTENVWHNPFLFPMYYMDNHYYRIMTLRGWKIYNTEHDLIYHSGSHMIKNDPVWRNINNIVFKYHGLIYKEIWGGYPGYETSCDLYAHGTLPPKTNI